MRPVFALLLLCALPAIAQHDISQVEPAPRDGVASTPIPTKRGYKKYDIPDLAGAKQALGSQLLDGRLRKPLVDFIVAEGSVEQRVSIFEGGLVVVNMTGAATIRKKMLIPEHALQSYTKSISPQSLALVDQQSLVLPEPSRRSVLRVYEPSGRYVERVFNPTRVLPKSLNDQITPLRDLLRAISEDRSVTSSVAGYEPKAGDELVSDDQKVYRVMRVVDGADIVELKCLDAPTTIYVVKKDLHLYFVGRNGE
ncbi:MAG TPA: hypothetical protein VGQ76_27205 [Thermoanaerobaculia bacterium]|jgi:hypothetical protein|nr:hypothetical protein [Thermoanaerobaculia bacterium]